MLTHHWEKSTKPKRIVILGANGFLSGSLARRLQADGNQVRAIGSGEIDLSADGAGNQLAERLDGDDALVIMSAITPDKGRDVAAFMTNMAMGRNICEAMASCPVAHVVYVSSDAVYPLVEGLVDEESPAAPTDLYGVMHRAREIMIDGTVACPYAIVRPTMVLGAGDTHNSYGPNRFRRQAAAEAKIVLGGGGEETRDHIFVDDAVALLELILCHRSAGILNLVTGRSISFFDLAKLVASHFTPAAEVITTERKFPITHRHFDAVAVHKAFPGFHFTSLEDAIAGVNEAAANGSSRS